MDTVVCRRRHDRSLPDGKAHRKHLYIRPLDKSLVDRMPAIFLYGMSTKLRDKASRDKQPCTTQAVDFEDEIFPSQTSSDTIGSSPFFCIYE